MIFLRYLILKKWWRIMRLEQFNPGQRIITKGNGGSKKFLATVVGRNIQVGIKAVLVRFDKPNDWSWSIRDIIDFKTRNGIDVSPYWKSGAVFYWLYAE